MTEFLDLTLDDVGSHIELVYTPVRNDGMKGNPRSIMSDAIAPGNFIYLLGLLHCSFLEDLHSMLLF